MNSDRRTVLKQLAAAAAVTVAERLTPGVTRAIAHGLDHAVFGPEIIAALHPAEQQGHDHREHQRHLHRRRAAGVAQERAEPGHHRTRYGTSRRTACVL